MVIFLVPFITFLSVRAEVSSGAYSVKDDVAVVQSWLSKHNDDGGVAADMGIRERVIAPVAIDKVFFAIETSDEHAKPGGRLDGQCQTWLNGVPNSSVAVFSDHGEELAFPCNAKVEKCCGRLDYLGDNISVAQFKRELIHAQLHEMVPQDIRWIVSTESDVWYNVPLLLQYLGELEAMHPDQDNTPISAGHFYGPALILNRRLFENTLGNASFVNSCRQELLQCLDGTIPEKDRSEECKTARKRSGYAYEGTFYNNDHLIAYCFARFSAQNVGHQALRQSLSTTLEDATKICSETDQQLQMLVGNIRSHYISVNETGWHAIPPNVLMIHHVDAHAMQELQALPISSRDTRICADGKPCLEACQALHNVSYNGESRYAFPNKK